MRRFLWDWRQTEGSGAEPGTGGRRGGSRGAVGPVRRGSTGQQPLRRFCPDPPGQPGALRRLELATALPLGGRRLWGAGSRTLRSRGPKAAFAAESTCWGLRGRGTEAGPQMREASRRRAGPARGSLFSPGSGWARLSLARRPYKPRTGRSSPSAGSARGSTSSCPLPRPPARNVGMLQGESG